jgi:hypothetical protein
MESAPPSGTAMPTRTARSCVYRREIAEWSPRSMYSGTKRPNVVCAPRPVDIVSSPTIASTAAKEP